MALALNADFYAVDAAHMMAIAEPPAAQISWAERAIELAEASGDPETNRWLGSLYNNLGWSYHETGDHVRALSIFEKSLAWRQAHDPGSQAERIARWTIGRALRSLGRLDEALALQLALEQANRAAGAADGYVQEEIGELLLAKQAPAEAAPYFAAAYRLLSEDPWLAAHEKERLARLKELGMNRNLN